MRSTQRGHSIVSGIVPDRCFIGLTVYHICIGNRLEGVIIDSFADKDFREFIHLEFLIFRLRESSKAHCFRGICFAINKSSIDICLSRY